MTTGARADQAAALPSSGPAGYAAVWFGFLGSAAAWAISELVSYMLVAHACYPNADALATPSSDAAWPAAVIVTAVMLATSVATFIVSWRATARLMRGAGGYDGWAAQTGGSTARGYLAFGGVLFSAIFGAFIIYNLIALFAEPICRISQ
jgi:hypothetical protein